MRIRVIYTFVIYERRNVFPANIKVIRHALYDGEIVFLHTPHIHIHTCVTRAHTRNYDEFVNYYRRNLEFTDAANEMGR